MTNLNQFEEKAAERRFFFRKENRILRRADFLKVYSQGRAWRRPLIHVFILPPDDPAGAGQGVDDRATSGNQTVSAAHSISPTRLGITATKKVGNSVKRNRGRRLVRESFRRMLPDLKPGYSIVVNVMRAATLSKLAPVDRQLREIFVQAGLLEIDSDQRNL